MKPKIVFIKQTKHNFNGVKIGFLFLVYWQNDQYWFRATKLVNNQTAVGTEISIEIDKPAKSALNITEFPNKDFESFAPIVNWYKILEKERILQLRASELVKVK